MAEHSNDLLDDIRRHREAGTPGPWRYETGPSLRGRYATVMAGDGMIAECWDGTEVQDHANAKRCARVPDLENRVLSDADHIAALEAEVERLRKTNSGLLRGLDVVKQTARDRALEDAAKACERAAYDGRYRHDDKIELGCLRSRDYIRELQSLQPSPAPSEAVRERVFAKTLDAIHGEVSGIVGNSLMVGMAHNITDAAISALASEGEQPC